MVLSLADLVSKLVYSDASTGYYVIGKISFSTKDIIGRGCEGTFVYRYVMCNNCYVQVRYV